LVRTFNAIGTSEYSVQALSNSTIESFTYYLSSRLGFNVTGQEGNRGYFYVAFPKGLLTGPCQVYVNGELVDQVRVDLREVFLYFEYIHNVNTIIVDIISLETLSSDLNSDGIVNILDIAIIARAFQSKLGDSNWNENADVDKNGIVNIMDLYEVARDYGKTL